MTATTDRNCSQILVFGSLRTNMYIHRVQEKSGTYVMTKIKCNTFFLYTVYM